MTERNQNQHVAPRADRTSVLVRQELLERLRGLDYLSFERVVLRLLVAMGYENARLRGRTARSKNRDGGADIEATARTGVTLTKVLVQAKQYAVPVQAKYVDELRGALQRLGAVHGLIVSTAEFSPVAAEWARSSAAHPVRLLGGDALARLLVRYRIGVRTTLRPVLAVDDDFISSLGGDGGR